MQTLHILKELKLSVKPASKCEPRLSPENGPILPLNTLSLPSTFNITPAS